MKKITALFTVLLMLVASSAFAAITIPANTPAGLTGADGNGGYANQYLIMNGFSSNASFRIINDAVAMEKCANASFVYFNSSYNGIMVNGTGMGVGYNSTLTTFNGTTELANANAWYNHDMNPQVLGHIEQVKWQNWDANLNAAGLLYNNIYNLGNETQAGAAAADQGTYNNSTNSTLYMAATSGQRLLVGLTNSTVMGTSNGTAANNPKQRKGNTFFTMYKPGTFDAKTTANGKIADIYNSSWNYYAYGMEASEGLPGFIMGKVTFGDSSATTANVRFWAEVNGTTTDATGSDLSFTVSKTSNYLSLVKDDLPLLQNATVNEDNNLITGYMYDWAEGDKLFVVMTKEATTISEADIKDHSFFLVYAGNNYALNNLRGNSTAGIVDMAIDSDMTISGTGQFRFGVASNDGTGDTFRNLDLSGDTVRLADTSQFGLTQSNMTIVDGTDSSVIKGSFLGTIAADKAYSVGIYVPYNGSSEQACSIAFLINKPAVTGTMVAANPTYQHNASIDWKQTAGAVDYFTINATAYSAPQMKNIWTSLPSNFVPLTDLIGFNGTIAGVQANSEKALITMQIPVTGLGDKVEKLRLYKLMPNDAKSVHALSYASSADKDNAGVWWISTAVGDGYQPQDAVLARGVQYYVNYVIQDNGQYDAASGTDLELIDPVVLGSVPSSSSSSSGCVFNPAAGFGLEWLLLMLAPMVAIVRSRFK